MQIIYTGEKLPETITKSIFLAGPSLRPGQEKELESWRKDAIKILEDKGFDGTIFCPENKGFGFENKDFNYDDQIEWEHKCLNVADCILFWVPRDVSLDKNNQLKMPAFTTNVEFGAWADSGKVVFGCPPDLKERKNKYLKYYADFYNIDGGSTLTETLDAAMDMLGDGSDRSGGERYVPLFIWNTDSFQSWYSSQKEAGNRLDHAELLWTFRPQHKKFVFIWSLMVDVFIKSENRNKTNEFVLARTDISSVCLYHKANAAPLEDTEIVLVKEFRSPANTKDGFIRELPGGSSSKKDEDPKDVAADEVHEETGFHLKSDRLKSHGARQMAGTFSAHKCNLYSMELSEEEMKWFKSQKDIVHGNSEDSERTFIEVYSIKELIDNELTDWSTLGLIYSATFS
jgi:8-oxo-dGTP pyrophosphatase MutT (NUDIX family)